MPTSLPAGEWSPDSFALTAAAFAQLESEPTLASYALLFLMAQDTAGLRYIDDLPCAERRKAVWNKTRQLRPA